MAKAFNFESEFLKPTLFPCHLQNLTHCFKLQTCNLKELT